MAMKQTRFTIFATLAALTLGLGAGRDWEIIFPFESK